MADTRRVKRTVDCQVEHGWVKAQGKDSGRHDTHCDKTIL